jgi:signal transduction histidine kinase/DNA-binding response OmpR family regulator
MKKKTRFAFGYIAGAILCVILVVATLFVRMIRNSLWETLALNSLELTKQGATSFATKLNNEEVTVSNLSGFLSTVASSDVEEIKNTVLIYTKEAETELIVFDLENGYAYTTAKDEPQVTTPGQLEEISSYADQGWVDPFYSIYDGKQYIGCYERFYFSDGAEGIIRKNIGIKGLGEQYSLSFYDNQGYSYIVDEAGNIIVRAEDKHSNRTLRNVFDVVEAGSNSKESVELFKNALSEQKTGVIRFDFENQKYLFAFDTIDGRNNWTLLSLIPEEALSKHLDSIMRTSSLVIIMAITIVVVVAILFFNKKLTQKEYDLQNALAAAQAANRSKTVFLNNMSHDIRTPMNAIIGYTALAAKHIDNKECLQDYLKKISQSSAHLLSLINDVLDMSRIESGKVNINEKEESLSEILHGLRDIVQADINSKKLDFYVDTVDLVDEDIFCDKLRLNQILLNIISNAIKYTPSGGYVSLRITQLKTTNNYGTYEFRIKDNGIGMSEEFLQTIFVPFTRANTSTVSGIQGTGLGMAITKNIVDMMGGTITCHSVENQGSEFIVTLDFKLQKQHKEQTKIAQLEDLRGLVVDDDMNSCQSISQMLRQVGMRSEWCTQGKEAIVRTKEAIRIGDRFEVYIIDWQMPDMNGIEVTRQIRSEVGDDAPIIILTAYDWSDIEDEARKAGVTDFISKPLFMSDLRTVLTKACEQPESGTSDTSKGEVKEVDMSGKRLLLVEDNEFNREIAVDILSETGMEIEEAEDGSVAVEKLLEKGAGYYNLVLMDIQMPIMDGYTAARKIRSFEDAQLANIPIIALSANAFEEDKQKSLDAGMNAHIAKPIDIGELMETLAQIV